MKYNSEISPRRVRPRNRVPRSGQESKVARTVAPLAPGRKGSDEERGSGTTTSRQSRRRSQIISLPRRKCATSSSRRRAIVSVVLIFLVYFFPIIFKFHFNFRRCYDGWRIEQQCLQREPHTSTRIGYQCLESFRPKRSTVS